MNGLMFQYGDEAIRVTNFPGYKRPALAIQNGFVIRKVASFSSEEDAELFSELLSRWLGTKNNLSNSIGLQEK